MTRSKQPSAEALVADLVPVELAEVRARASLEQRLDRKYLVDWLCVSAFVAALAETHAVLEVDGRRTFRYITDYYDSAGLACYHAHIQRRRRRYKARVREYGDSGYRRVEVKLRGRRGETVKHWTDERTDPGTFTRSTISREYGKEVDDLVRTIRVRCRRITLVARDSVERVTIDYDLRFEREGRDKAWLLPGFAIVETKSGSASGLADHVLRRLGARPVSISKYVVGVGLLTPHVPNDVRPLTRRYFRCQTGDQRTAYV